MCLFITNYLNGSDFSGPAGRLTSKWWVRGSSVVGSDCHSPGNLKPGHHDKSCNIRKQIDPRWEPLVRLFRAPYDRP